MGKTATPTVSFFRGNGRINIMRLVVLTTLIIATFWAFSPLLNRLDQERQLEILNSQVKNAKKYEAELRAEIKLLQTDNNYIEQVAREKLGLIMPDEEGYVVVDPRSQAVTGTPAAAKGKDEPIKKESGWLQQSLDYLIGLGEKI